MEDAPTALTEVDGLSHDDLAASIARNIDSLPAGSVIAIQAAWGRGKTDVLNRVARLFRESSDSAADPLWINPWQYGTPNLISPLVTELLQRLEPEQRSGNTRLKDASETLLRAGNAVAFKALSVFVPFGELLSGGQAPVDELIARLFSPDQPGEPLDTDPIAAMARRFRDLIDEYLIITGSSGPVVVCVDDLDRCLPDQQIAMLEAMHFLTSAGAHANFVVAIDPRLVQQAAVSHYSGSSFDVEQYLNKLFDLRVNLTALAGPLRKSFLALALKELDEMTPSAATRLGIEQDVFAATWNEAFYLPELSNPRLISRAVRRFGLYLASEPDPLGIEGLDEPSEADRIGRVGVLVRLVAITERWPDLRLLVQVMDPDGLEERLRQFAAHFGWPSDGTATNAGRGGGAAEAPWLFNRLPDRKRHPDFGLFLDDLLALPNVAEVIDCLDRKLTAAGL